MAKKNFFLGQLDHIEFVVIFTKYQNKWVLCWHKRRQSFENPGGHVEPGETAMQAARRELYEETGYGGGEWSHLMTVSPNPGACTNSSHTFLAVGVERLSEQHLEESEDIKVVLLEREEVIRMLKNDEFHQAMMAAPLWKYFAMDKLKS